MPTPTIYVAVDSCRTQEDHESIYFIYHKYLLIYLWQTSFCNF
uniref:Uncharacterized protein n=1 Tax=Arundo donax TaxID=35708 RepID=A0A0A9E2N1_ARUDO